MGSTEINFHQPNIILQKALVSNAITYNFETLFKIKPLLVLVEALIEPVAAELVEASKRLRKKANKAGGFDRLSRRRVPILKIDFRACWYIWSKNQ